MADAQRDLKIVLSADTKQAEKEIGGFGGSLTRIGEIAAGVGLAGLADKIVSFGKQALQAGIETASFYENARIGLTTLLGDQGKAIQTLNQIKKDALTTPFDASQLVRANQLLISAGISAEQSRKDILNLGNAVMATGGGNDELMRLAVNLQQIQATGQATALDIKQFGFAGINIYKLLEQSTGKNVAALKDSTISYQDLTKALEVAAGQGGLFAGAIQNAGGSFQQTFSNMKEAVNNFFADLVTKLGIFDGLKVVMQQFTETLNNVSLAIQGLVSGSLSVNDIVNQLKANYPQLTLAIQTIASLLTAVFTPLLKELQQIWEKHHDTIVLIGQLLLGLFIGALVAVITVLGVLIGVVALVIDILLTIVDKIKGLVIPVINFLYDAIVKNIGIWNQLSSVVESVVNSIVNNAKSMANGVIDSINRMIDSFNSLGSRVHISLPNIPKFAGGVENFSGGMAIVGEKGPELVNLPRGSSVTPNNKLAGTGTVNININNPVVREENDIDRIIEAVKKALGRENELARLAAI